MKSLKIWLILWAVSALRRMGYPRPAGREEKRFLVVSTTGVGDTLWGTPAIRALKESREGAFVCVLTNPPGRELLKGNPFIDELLTFRRGLRGVLSLPCALKRLSKGKYDTAFIFHASDRIVWLLAFLSRAPEIIGPDRDNKGLDPVLTKKVAQAGGHGIERRLALVAEKRARTDERLLSVCLEPAEIEEAGAFLERAGMGGPGPIVGIHPGAQKPFKCWPPERFVEVANMLAVRFGCRVVVTGDRGERPLAERIASGVRGAVSAAGARSLRQTAALISRMSLFITNDTGPMHVAFAVGIPTVALFCPTDPDLCGPYRALRAAVIRKQTTCEPCAGKKCTVPRCMEQITVEEVYRAARSFLGSAPEGIDRG